MDETRLAELFRDVVRDAPPATFDGEDVIRAAYRASSKRRSAIFAGSALVLVLFAAGLTFGIVHRGHHMDGHRSSSVAIGPHTAGRSFHARGAYGNQDLPGSTSTQGRDEPGAAGSNAGITPNGCGPTDRELAPALADELPAVGSAGPVEMNCPAQARGASYAVVDGQSVGRISVILLPAHSAASALVVPSDAVASTVVTASGRELTVLSQPARGSKAPFGDRISTIASQLASKF